jgi:hypothetical protein
MIVQFPIPRVPRPAPWIAISGVTINLLAACQNRGIPTTVTLVWRHEFQAAVLVLESPPFS